MNRPLIDACVSFYGEPDATRAQLAAAFVFENPLRPVLLAILAAELLILGAVL